MAYNADLLQKFWALRAKRAQTCRTQVRRAKQETAEAHYEVHKERPFYPGLIKFVTSGPVVCMAWSGKDAITVARTLIGSTNGREASPGTIRGDFGMDMGFNMIHGSDAAETAAFELGLWFPEGLMEWDQTITAWVYE